MGLFAFLFVVSIVMFIVGMIKPGVVIRWGLPEQRTRKKVAQTYLSAVVISFVLFGLTMDKTTPKTVAPNLPASANAVKTTESKPAQPSAEEVQKQKEQQEQAKRDKLQSIIRVSKLFTSDPNSAGGVDFHVIWQNTSDKVIKYCNFSVVPYNAVNDSVKCTIRHSSEYNGRVTGPVNPKEWYGEGYRWSNAWYNNTIVRAELIGIRVEYMDGTTENIRKEDIKYVMY